MENELLLGVHVSVADGLLGAAVEAKAYGANVFMTYTGAPQNTIRKTLDKMKLDEGHEFMKLAGILGFVVHAPYIINLASPKPDIYDLAVNFLKMELDRTECMGAEYLVLHPGSYTNSSAEQGVTRIINALDSVFSVGGETVVCLETMAGKGGELGKTFEELKTIIDGVKEPGRLAVCFDTCHVHDAGYDIINDLDGVMAEFDAVVGLERIKVFHINGSLNPCGLRKDRHANIGADSSNPKGEDHIGFKAINALVHSKYTAGRYMILETPWLNDTENLYKQELAALRRGYL